MVGVITLGIETATTTVSVALGGDDGPLGTVEINRGRRHAEVVAPAIEFVCRHAQVSFDQIAVIGVDIGPGLFTGMRVGIATAKVMAQTLQVRIVGISSLDLLAHPLRHEQRIIASVIDARKGEVFYAFYRAEGEGLRRVGEPAVGSVADFNADVLARGQDVVAVGDGAWRYRDELETSVEVADLAHPSAATLVALSRVIALRDGDAGVVQPMYLRAPDAQINWSSR